MRDHGRTLREIVLDDRALARRFQKIEEEIRGRGKKLEHSTLEEMDAIWNEGKKAEKMSKSR